MIKLTELEKVYRTSSIETVALNNINVHIKRGEFVSIMGPSGCGKSTLLNMMGLLDAPSKGLVEIEGSPVSGYQDKALAQLRNQKIGFVFQSYHLINDLNVVDNVELPLLYRKGVAGKERRQKALAALDKVGLNARVKHYPTQLSGGQCQRVAIARAVVGEPEIILADEPTGNLDSEMGSEIMNILLNLNKEGTTIIMVTHDESLAKQTQHIIRLFDGSIVN
jgi:putative ABC transport system ATP-binding protein